MACRRADVLAHFEERTGRAAGVAADARGGKRGARERVREDEGHKRSKVEEVKR